MVEPTLLVLETDRALQTLIATILSQAGYTVHTTLPEEYLYTVQRISPMLVILSCDRYGMSISGWDLASIVRRERPQTLLVMLSTDPASVEEVGVTARGRQFIAALRKPFLAEELLALVTGCVPLPQQREHVG